MDDTKSFPFLVLLLFLFFASTGRSQKSTNIEQKKNTKDKKNHPINKGLDLGLVIVHNECLTMTLTHASPFGSAEEGEGTKSEIDMHVKEKRRN